MRKILILVVLVMPCQGARAASFDCNKAATADEHAVCADPRLSELDSIAGAAFNQAKQLAGPAEITPVARDFLAARRACGGNASCIMASYIGIIDTYHDRGSKVRLPDWADATAIAGGDPTRSNVIPKSVGQCFITAVMEVTPRLDPGHRPTSGDFDSGTAITFTDKAYQVSYEREDALLRSQPGDAVVLCLVSVPRHCPPGDARGRVYAATNLRTHSAWLLPDAEHSCGGA